VISHRANTLRNVDFFVVLDEGRVAAVGDHATLLKDSALYRELTGVSGDGSAPPTRLRPPRREAKPAWSDDREPRPRPRE
jgi:hypothetical protein